MRREVQLTVPAMEESLLCIRLTCAGLLAFCRIDVDTADLFKHAVSEACYALLHQKRSAANLALLFQKDEEALSVQCTLSGSPCETDEQVADAAVCACVLETMADRVEIDLVDECMQAIRLYAFFL